jgi:hypothetical protein
MSVLLYKKLHLFLFAGTITLVAQAILVGLNIEGDRSIAYWLTCGAILVCNFGIILALEACKRTKLPVYVFLGFVVGAVAGLVALLLFRKTSITGVFSITPFHPSFGMLLIEWWCLYTALFGATFNATFWLLRKMSGAFT